MAESSIGLSSNLLPAKGMQETSRVCRTSPSDVVPVDPMNHASLPGPAKI